jgi:hypothetical protein
MASLVKEITIDECLTALNKNLVTDELSKLNIIHIQNAMFKINGFNKIAFITTNNDTDIFVYKHTDNNFYRIDKSDDNITASLLPKIVNDFDNYNNLFVPKLAVKENDTPRIISETDFISSLYTEIRSRDFIDTTPTINDCQRAVDIILEIGEPTELLPMPTINEMMYAINHLKSHPDKKVIFMSSGITGEWTIYCFRANNNKFYQIIKRNNILLASSLV